MAVPFSEIVQSDIFTFHVGGEERAERKTYSKAIAATSDKMRALVTGGMRESDTRSAVLEDVLVEDFDRFYEYALRGDYTAPSWQLDRDIVTNADEDPRYIEMPPPAPPPPEFFDPDLPVEPPTTNRDPGAPLDDGWGFGSSIKKKKVKKAKDKSMIQKRFDGRTYITEGNPKADIESGFQTPYNWISNQDFKPVFLAHARLYTFADMHFVEPLKNLALQKLHETLRTFELFPARIGDVIELVRYAYDHNLDRKENGGVDELRKLVIEYIARWIDVIGKSTEFERLLEEGGEFVVDFWRAAQEYKILA